MRFVVNFAGAVREKSKTKMIKLFTNSKTTKHVGYSVMDVLLGGEITPVNLRPRKQIKYKPLFKYSTPIS